MGESTERAQEIVIGIENIGKEKENLFYNENGIKITENNLKKIFQEYFRGTALENISYQ